MSDNNCQNDEASDKKKCSCVRGSKSILKLLSGIIFVILGLLAVIGWWVDLWAVVRGCVGIVLVLIGAITIAISKE